MVNSKIFVRPILGFIALAVVGACGTDEGDQIIVAEEQKQQASAGPGLCPQVITFDETTNNLGDIITFKYLSRGAIFSSPRGYPLLINEQHPGQAGDAKPTSHPFALGANNQAINQDDPLIINFLADTEKISFFIIDVESPAVANFYDANATLLERIDISSQGGSGLNTKIQSTAQGVRSAEITNFSGDGIALDDLSYEIACSFSFSPVAIQLAPQGTSVVEPVETILPATSLPVVVQQTGQFIDKSAITAFHNDYRRDPALTIDIDRTTFWHSDNMTGGEVKWLAYKFSQTTTLFSIEVINDYTNAYNMGELNILISQDSTDGNDGNWTIIEQIPGDSIFSGGDSFIDFNTAISTKWIKLEMTYQGRGAYGGTPAFYLSEINFYQ